MNRRAAPQTDKNATHKPWRPGASPRLRNDGGMTLGERLKLVRGTASQRAFAAELGMHENTISNAERRNSATQEYLLKLATARSVNLHWLLTGHGPMRVAELDGSLLQEKINLALADALRLASGTRYPRR